MPSYTEPNFNRAMELLLKSHGIDYYFMPCALGKPNREQRWHIPLPNIPAERWRNRNFRLVIHAQDFIHFYQKFKEFFFITIYNNLIIYFFNFDLIFLYKVLNNIPIVNSILISMTVFQTKHLNFLRVITCENFCS